jgi:hypothetical protein
MLFTVFIYFGCHFHIKNEMIMQAQNAQEESQRMTAVRKIYQKAIVTPTHHIEQLWKDYENFENSVSRQLVTFWFWIAVVNLTSWY